MKTCENILKSKQNFKNQSYGIQQISVHVLAAIEVGFLLVNQLIIGYHRMIFLNLVFLWIWHIKSINKWHSKYKNYIHTHAKSNNHTKKTYTCASGDIFPRVIAETPFHMYHRLSGYWPTIKKNLLATLSWGDVRICTWLTTACS